MPSSATAVPARFRESWSAAARATQPFAEAFCLFAIVMSGGKAMPFGVRMLVIVALALPLLVSSGRRAAGRIMFWWAILFVSCVLFVALRGIADDLGRPVVVDAPIAAERMIGLGSVPTLELQSRFYVPGAPRWWDHAAVIVYGMHFPLIMIVGALLMLRRSRALGPYLVATGALHLLAVPIHFAWPTAPPWLAGAMGHLPVVSRLLLEVGADMSPGTVRAGLRISANEVAALPSIHMAMGFLIALASWRHGGVGRILGPSYAAIAALVIVYTGEHYVVDALAGMLLGWIGWRLALSYTARGRHEPHWKGAHVLRSARESAPLRGGD